MDVIDSGIAMEVRPLKEKAFHPIEVTELGIMVVLQPRINTLSAVRMIALQLFLESYTGFPTSTTICSKSLQPDNMLLPIEVTDCGMTIETKFRQS